MPANLPPQYYELEREFRAERDLREKLRMAKELLRMMPKHKGTDKLQADMKTKISNLNKEITGGSTSGGAIHQTATHDFIEKEGAGQIILIGPPNCGKSSLVDSLTHAEPLVADYPYSTREPLAGMMPFETIQIQLIDTPPVSPEMFENYLPNLVRNADIVMLVCDLSDQNMISNTDFVLNQLQEKRIIFAPNFNKQSEDPRLRIKKMFICAHKEYDDESGEGLRGLKMRFPGFVIIPTSILDGGSLEKLKSALFQSLSIIRVYTKHVGKDVKLEDPVILPAGGTVEEAAIEIHKDFGQKLKFAKIWGEGKYDGQRVNRDYALTDEDIVEFHI